MISRIASTTFSQAFQNMPDDVHLQVDEKNSVFYRRSEMEQIPFDGGNLHVVLEPQARDFFNHFMATHSSNLGLHNGTGIDPATGTFCIDGKPVGILEGPQGRSNEENIAALQASGQPTGYASTPSYGNTPLPSSLFHQPAQHPKRSHPSPGTTITTTATSEGTHKGVQMRNHYYGVGATPENIQKVNQAIESYWTGTWPGQNGRPVQIQTHVESTNDTHNVNWIELHNDPSRSFVHLGRGTGSWSVHPPLQHDSTGGPAIWAHEAGHLLGFEDYYVEDRFGYGKPLPGHERDLMGANTGGSYVTNAEAIALGTI